MPQPGAPQEQLQFSDPAGLQAWRERLPLTNPVQCHAALASQASQLARAALPAATRLTLLESLRDLAHTLQDELGKKYRGKPVPLDDDDRATWDGVVAVWNTLAGGYALLIEAKAPEISTAAPLIYQRALRCTGLAMAEHSVIYRNVPGALWQQLHRLYLAAENAGAATAPIDDPVDRAVPATSCTGTYLHAVLLQLAQPAALSVQQMDAVDAWLERWATYASLAGGPSPAGPALAVDLASDQGATLAVDPPAAGVRHLNLENLGKAVRQAAVGLKQGQTPAQLGLGGIRRDACEKLLMLLHIQWCAAGTGRADERSPGGVVVTISPNLAAIHYQLTGRAFRQPGGEITARERQDMDMMGRISDDTQRAMVSQRSASIETWVIVNKSASGFLGMCRNPNSATHIGHNQLLGLRNPANKNMYLGVVQRLIVDETGGIWIGLRLITGNPQACSARVTGAGARGPEAARFDRALLVPEDAARKVPASVLLMPGWYMANRQLDLQADKPQKIKLQALLDKGPNFERATFAGA